MPFINTKYSGAITAADETEIRSALADAVKLLGKSETWLMVGFEQNCSLYFRGEKSEKIAFVEVNLYGSASAAAYDTYDKFTAEVCGILGRVLGVPADKIYVKYSPTEFWGWNGGNF